jgi:hypothetical protein
MKYFSKSKNSLAWLLVATWLLGVVFAFWWFELRWYQQVTFEYHDAVFDSRTMMPDATMGASIKPDAVAKVIHYFDPECPCTRFNTEHVLELMERYQASGVKFEVRVPNTAGLEKALKIFSAPVQIVEYAAAPVASPAALVLDSAGLVHYIGPYSPGAVCSTRSGDFVSIVLDDLLEGRPALQDVNLARGCFCSWPE